MWFRPTIRELPQARYAFEATGSVNLAPGEYTIRTISDDGLRVWVDGPVGLGSRRLAIIDLSPRAHMPMSNEDGSLWIVLNGEIYNFHELRRDLIGKGHQFRSNSDTETILHLYEEEGVECLQRLRGMFAFALWDAKRQTLFLARDRLGKKPLYYYHDRNVFLFASEPKAILQDPHVRAEADPEAIHHYLTYGYVPGAHSAFRGMRKLPPAHRRRDFVRRLRPRDIRRNAGLTRPSHLGKSVGLAVLIRARLPCP